MTILSRQIDEWVVIGEKLTLSPTDIDADGARIVVRGRLIGGADDGLTVDRSHELAVGSSVRLGDLVSVTLMKIAPAESAQVNNGPRAVFGIQAPPNLTIHRKELSNPSGPRPGAEEPG
jgi:sRNA-binding carbon storage regulator CsrA